AGLDRNVRDAHGVLGGLDQITLALRAAQGRVPARRRQNTLHHPPTEMVPQRVHRLRVRHGIRAEDALAVVVAGAVHHRAWRGLVEAAAAAAVRGAGDVVAADVVRQRDVVLRIGADPLGPELQRPDLGGAEVLDDLRARAGLVATIEDAARRQTARVVGERVPPLRPFAARLVELEHAVRLRPAEVQRDAPAGDDRPRAVVQLPPGLVLVEAEVQEAAQEVARLGRPAADAPPDRPGRG